MKDGFFPQVEWIINALHARILPLPGYVPATRQGVGRIAELNAAGV